MADYTVVAVFLFGALAAAGFLFFVQWLISPKHPAPTKLSPYECGEVPIGDAQVRFNFRFYIYAILFVLFEVEAIFFFPWANAFRDLFKIMLWPAFWEMVIFLAILFIGWLYAYYKGVLKWQ